MSFTLSFRLPDDIFESLNKLCKELDRPKSYIIKKALEQYISEHSDNQAALARLKDKEDKIISSKELRDQLGI